MALFSYPNTEADSQFTPSRIPTLDELIALEASSAPLVRAAAPPPTTPSLEHSERNWQTLAQEEGQLAIDVYETDDQIILVSAIAGVKSQDLELSLQQDMLTIRGVRTAPPETMEGDALIAECYWGGFSRTVILPSAVDPQSASARLTSGVLSIQLKKLPGAGSIPIVEEIEEGEM